VSDRDRDEGELVRRCREGSEAAYAELVRSHRPRLFALAYRLLGDRETAEDVVQDTFLAAFRAIERVEPRPSLSPWLNTIALRIAGRAAERTRSRPKASLDQMAAAGVDEPTSDRLIHLQPAADPHAAAEAAELRTTLTEAIAALPFSHRAAVTLRYVMGLDYADAAASMGVPLNTFKSHLLRGTRALRESLGASLAGTNPDALTNGNGHRTADIRAGATWATDEPSAERAVAEHAAVERLARG
jgi:RNA polymerase sigma-70 factor (ECF subfamily)